MTHLRAIRAFLHTIWLRRVDLYSYTSSFASSIHLYGDSNATMPIHSFVAHHSSCIFVCPAYITQKHRMEAIRAFLHTIWWRRVDLYSYSSCFASSIHLYGDSNATMPNHCFVAHHSSTFFSFVLFYD